MQVRKVDDERQVVVGEVYAPGVPDSQGDFMTGPEIEAAAWAFLAKGRTSKVDVNHDHELSGSLVVESFIARKNDPDGFIEGAWVAAVHIPNRDLWNKVKTGEINGFSLEATVTARRTRVALMVPDVIMGETETAMDSNGRSHSHRYKVGFTMDDLLIEGHTLEDDSHHGFHAIRNGTVTEITDDHRHRYRLIDALDHIEILDTDVTGPGATTQ